MKKRPVTSRDVAALAGVSQSAVSRCFSPNASISDRTRQKVLEAAKTLGYHPNRIARSLITRSSRVIAVVMSQLDNPFYSLAIDRASRYFQREGFHLLLFMVGEDGESEGVMAEILQSQADGILMLSASLSSSLAQECADRNISVVVINRTVDFAGVSQVSSDNYDGGYWVGSFLAAAGHERIAFIAGLSSSSTSEYRRKGFMEGLAAAGKSCFAIERGDYQFDLARAATRRLFSKPPWPDAIFAANDYMAIAVIETLRDELGLGVPQDVSVVGFDDMPMSAWPSYRLTTVQQPLERMVTEAAELLLEQVREGSVSAVHKVMPVVPILRESARRPSLILSDGHL
ncbi:MULTISPECIES: LacI family DNA-binding transcriptional regulator [Halomonadaceae]|uniref:LacI family DNA-binding transcriptional regulator n=1 Tax=Halomonadaceae TaxID=28256 RepID=UPI0015971D39|nr:MULTISPECIES: LacI family DNA-binding transcriptional regulator [Halomonas]QJQ94990.1 LacI family DNA-binding transcriptional regulator [Halomonas sp. PA5]